MDTHSLDVAKYFFFFLGLLNLVNTLFSLIYLPFIGTLLLGKVADATLNNGLDRALKDTSLSPVSGAQP